MGVPKSLWGGSPSPLPCLCHQKEPQHIEETPKVLMGLPHLPGLIFIIEKGLNIEKITPRSSRGSLRSPQGSLNLHVLLIFI